MPTVQAQLETIFHQAIRDAFGIDADPLISVAQNPQFGDYQSNVAMSLSKQLSQSGAKANPRATATQIQDKLPIAGPIAAISIAGPGFINVTLDPKWIAERLKNGANEAKTVGGVSATDGPGANEAKSQQKVVVDYSGPNIAKQMHVGHLRSTIIGDAIARILENEATVIRQNHIGDWGTQFGMLIAYMQRESGETKPSNTATAVGDLEQFYRAAKQVFDQDAAFQTEARQQVVALQSGKPEARTAWQSIVDATRLEYQPIYQRLGVQLTQADERGESFYNDKLAAVVKELKDKGIAVESDGATVVFIDGEGKAPLIIQKSDGGYLYGTTDLAAIKFRVNELHADRIIYTTDSRQAQHFSQVFRTAEKAGWLRDGAVKLDFAPFGTMLGEDGKPFKTRSGDTVKLKDLLDEADERGYQLAKSKDDERVAKARERGEADASPMSDDDLKRIGHAVGVGAVKYSDLSKDRTSDYVFSWDKMLAMDGNTGPYLQYAYARIKSINRRAAASGVVASATTILELNAPQELTLAKHILRFGDVIASVARELKPHLLCTYLYEMATKFSGFYENCPVLQSEEPTRSSRLLLCNLTASTLAKGLDLLGIEHPEQM